MTLYFAQATTINEIPATIDFLDKIVHASLVTTHHFKDLDPAIIRKAEEELSETEQFRKSSLDDFIPNGVPILADVGHNGYTWGGIRGRYEVDLSLLEGDYLMSSAFVGCSSHVYVPLFPIALRKTATGIKQGIISPLNLSLPHDLVYVPGEFKEAEYDLYAADYIPAEGGIAFPKERIRIIAPPQQKSSCDREYDFYRGSELFHIRRSRLLNQVITARDARPPEWAVKAGVKKLKEVISALEDWVEANEIKLFGASKIKEIKKEEVKFAPQDLLDWRGTWYIYNTLQENKKNNSLEAIRKLNIFLLQQEFEKERGHFIVGTVQGDSQTIHLPYVPIELIKTSGC